MKGRIDHITRFTNGNNITTQVFYEDGRKFTYGTNDNIPNTALNILLYGCSTTKYTETGKVEYFR